MNQKMKKKITKEEFVQKVMAKDEKKVIVNKRKKYWSNFEKENETKIKYRW